MKKSTFLGNFIFWVAIAAVCCAFLAWYNTGDTEAARTAALATVPGTVGIVLAAPVLLYAIGAVGGLLFVYLKKVHVTSTIKSGCFIPATLALALFIAAVVPVISLGVDGGISLPTVIVVYSATMAPLLLVALGVLYAVGIAPLKE